MYTTYVLESIEHGRHYVGATQDLQKRLERHNQGRSTWTKSFRPWKVIYQEHFTTKSEALQRENQIKSYKGGKAFQKLIHTNGLNHQES